MLNEERLRSMKKTAYVVNAARCQLVNFEDLKKALREKWIAGAAMDAIEPFNMDDKDPISADTPTSAYTIWALWPQTALTQCFTT